MEDVIISGSLRKKTVRNSKIMEEQLIEVIIGGSIQKKTEMCIWAAETFGDNVELHDGLPILYFKNIQDAEWFVLRWK